MTMCPAYPERCESVIWTVPHSKDCPVMRSMKTPNWRPSFAANLFASIDWDYVFRQRR